MAENGRCRDEREGGSAPLPCGRTESACWGEREPLQQRDACLEDRNDNHGRILSAGKPQTMYNGPALLGLSSLHIFPDIVVLRNPVSEFKFQDDLVREGVVLTVGLELSSEREGFDGCQVGELVIVAGR
jgi:hypothetical protein